MSETIGQKASATRQLEEAGYRLLAKHHGHGAVLEPHEHSTCQLLFAVRGTMLVETTQGRWTVPPQRALWIPAGSPHAIQMMSDVDLRTLYFAPTLVDTLSRFTRRAQVHAVVASTLIRELVAHLFENPEDLEMGGLTARLLLHALRDAACLPTLLPMPIESKLRTELLELMADHQWHQPMAYLAARLAMSERTFTRKFTAQMGLSYRTWHQQARIVASLDLLAANRPIKSVAHALRFASPAAYIAAFGKIMGCSPLAFQRHDRSVT